MHAKEDKHVDSNPNLADNPSHNKLFSKDSAVVIFRLLSINPFFEETFVEAETNIKFSNNIHKFPELILGVGRQQGEDFIYSRLVICSKHFSDTLKKNSFVTSATKKKARTTNLNIVKMKDTDFSKLRPATTARTSER